MVKALLLILLLKLVVVKTDLLQPPAENVELVFVVSKYDSGYVQWQSYYDFY